MFHRGDLIGEVGRRPQTNLGLRQVAGEEGQRAGRVGNVADVDDLPRRAQQDARRPMLKGTQAADRGGKPVQERATAQRLTIGRGACYESRLACHRRCRRVTRAANPVPSSRSMPGSGTGGVCVSSVAEPVISARSPPPDNPKDVVTNRAS